jgi:hypothetical protein
LAGREPARLPGFPCVVGRPSGLFVRAQREYHPLLPLAMPLKTSLKTSLETPLEMSQRSPS